MITELSFIFLTIFLIAGGIIICVDNYAYLSTHTFWIGLVGLSSLGFFFITFYWNDLKSRILGETQT